MTEGVQQASPPALTPFNLISSAQRIELERLMEERSGLRRDQFAVNSWGFPIIPIPEPRHGSDKVRMAPRNVSDEFLGHPIYWINPSFTVFNRELETEERWSIRMFYLILGFGLWTDSLQWIDYPTSCGVDYTSSIQAYHQLGNPPCDLDGVQLLDEGDLQVPLEQVKSSFTITISHCTELLREGVGEFLELQAQRLAQARKVLGDVESRDFPRPDESGSIWAQSLGPNLDKLAYDYRNHQEAGEPTSWMVPHIYRNVRYVYDTIVEFDRIIAILLVPIIKSEETAAASYSTMTTLLSVANQKLSDREGKYDLEGLVEREINEGSASAMDRIRDRCWELYEDAWKRLRLALVNYHRMQREEEPYYSYTDMEIGHASQPSTTTVPRHMRHDRDEQATSLIDRIEDPEE